jgi:hypothetical protein
MKKLPSQSEVFARQRRNLMIYKTRAEAPKRGKASKYKRNKRVDFLEE